MTQHTPGPWFYEPATQKFEHCVYQKGGRIIFYTPKGDAESGANARLAAEAPAMLDLLKIIKAYLATPPSDEWNNAFREQITKIVIDAEGLEADISLSALEALNAITEGITQ